MYFGRLIAILLCMFFVAPPQLPARQMPGQPASPAQPTKPAGTPADAVYPQTRLPKGGLKILVLEGQNAVNSLISRSTINPVIQVLDSMEQPVEGATVIFEVSPLGPGGSFSGAPIAHFKTDYTGQATANLTPNDIAGTFTIRITATSGGHTAEARIRQTNDRKVPEAMIPLPPKPWYKDWKWWALIGAGAGAGVVTAVMLTNHNGTSTITISPGTITIGGPR